MTNVSEIIEALTTFIDNVTKNNRRLGELASNRAAANERLTSELAEKDRLIGEMSSKLAEHFHTQELLDLRADNERLKNELRKRDIMLSAFLKCEELSKVAEKGT